MPDEPTLFDPPPDPGAFDTDHRPPWSDPPTPMQIDTGLPLPLRGRSGNHDDRAVELLAALAEAGVSLDQVAHRLVDAVPAPPLRATDLRAVEAWLTNAVARCPDYWTGVIIRRAALDLQRQQRRARRWAEHHEQALTKQAADIAARKAGTYWRDRDARRVATKPVHIETSDGSWSAFKAGTSPVERPLERFSQPWSDGRWPLVSLWMHPPTTVSEGSREVAAAPSASPEPRLTTNAGDPSGPLHRSAGSPLPGRWESSSSGRSTPLGDDGPMAPRLAIEDHLRSGERLVRQASVVIRCASIDSEGLPRNAHATSRRYTRAGEPFVAISAELTIPGWSLELILAGPRLRTRRTYASLRAGAVLDAGFELLTTFSAPHYSVVLPSYDVETTQLLSSEAQRNIYFGRSEPA